MWICPFCSVLRHNVTIINVNKISVQNLRRAKKGSSENRTVKRRELR